MSLNWINTNKQMEKFTCPNCKQKISFKEAFAFKRNRDFFCEKCSARLKPKYMKSFNFGVIIGFISVVLPAQFFLFFERNLLCALAIGVCTGTLAFLSIVYHTYKTTEFKEA